MSETARRNNAIGCTVIIVLGILAFVISGLTGGNSGSQSSTPPRPYITRPNGQTIDESEAKVMCENMVRDRLKAPRTAKFVGRFDSAFVPLRKIGNTWRYNVTVDAENSFGALIRGEFLCIINGDTDRYSIEEQ
jgi:hypothetical protein